MDMESIVNTSGSKDHSIIDHIAALIASLAYVKLLKALDGNGLLRYEILSKTALKEYWPSLSRDLGSDILKTVASASAEHTVPIQLSLLDCLFCEWVYIIDLDDGKFEVFSGMAGKDYSGSTRFNDVQPAKASNSLENVLNRIGQGAAPALVKAFDFKELPNSAKKFVELVKDALKERDGEDNEESGEEGETGDENDGDESAGGDEAEGNDGTKSSSSIDNSTADGKGDKVTGEVEAEGTVGTHSNAETKFPISPDASAQTPASVSAAEGQHEKNDKGSGEGMPAVHNLKIGSGHAQHDSILRVYTRTE